MEYICITITEDKDNVISTAESIEKTLESAGYKKQRQYRTRVSTKKEDARKYIYVVESKFEDLLKTGDIIHEIEYKGIRHGVARPYGSDKYVGVADLEALSKLQSIYGNEQVKAIYVSNNQVYMDNRISRDVIQKIVEGAGEVIEVVDRN